MYRLLVVGCVALAIALPPAQAKRHATPTTITILFNPANPVMPCTAAPGTIVSALSIVGGNGGPITWSLTGGDTTDFALDSPSSPSGSFTGPNVVVGANGILNDNCSKTNIVTVTANQP